MEEKPHGSAGQENVRNPLAIVPSCCYNPRCLTASHTRCLPNSFLLPLY